MGFFKSVGKGVSGATDAVVDTGKQVGTSAGSAIVEGGKQGAVQGGKAVSYTGSKNGLRGDVSKFMLKKHGGKESLSHMGKQIGVSFFDPGTPITRYMYKMGMIGEKDKKDTQLGIDIVYGAGTGGVGTGAKALNESQRRRHGKGKRKEKKEKTKERHAAKEERTGKKIKNFKK